MVNREKAYIYDDLKKEVEKTGWIKLGYTEDGKLIQRNLKTGEIRELEKWVEIHRNE